MSVPSFSDLNTHLIPTAIQAGALIYSFYENQVDVSFKTDNSPVTEADQAAETFILNEIRAIWPEIDIIAEELCSQTGLSQPGDTFFLVDPLDGTKEFINGRQDFTVNIALIHNNKPIYGIIYAPALNSLFVSLEEGKAVMAEQPPSAMKVNIDELDFHDIHVRQWPDNNAISVESRSHPDEKTIAFLKDMDISNRIVAGSSLKFCEVARGNADIYARFGPTMEWDIAAGDAILRVAGGCVYNQDCEPMMYGKFSSDFRNGAFFGCDVASLAKIKDHYSQI